MLTDSVRRAGLKVVRVDDVLGEPFEIMNPRHFNNIKKYLRCRRVRWLHGAQPCKTFSIARRRDRFGKVVRLRSKDHPEGLTKSDAVALANNVVSRFARLCRVQIRAGGWFSIENPKRSYLWNFRPIASILRLPEVELKCGDQCCLGGFYRKATGWASNAPWLDVVKLRCPGFPEHPRHLTIEGFVYRPGVPRVWMSETTAAYPESLTNHLAEAYADALHLAPGHAEAKHTAFTMDGRAPALDEAARKDVREQENRECIGGLRTPHLSKAKVPGWYDVGVGPPPS